jgi:hypothetical protein
MRDWIEPPLEPPEDYYDDGNCMDFTCDEEEEAWYGGYWREEDWRGDFVEDDVPRNKWQTISLDRKRRTEKRKRRR